jgi:alpha-glucosidase (family GH31 glycosyl hydrolase)
MGFPVWGNDTGGYLGEGRIDELLYLRWLQWSVWNGMFEIKIDGAGGSGEDRPPWKYSERLQNVFKNMCTFRMDMLPYIYSCANTSYKTGVMMKPLAYMYPQDENTYIIWDEFIFGNVFLVAPIFSKENEREIYLPAEKWYDFYEPTDEYTGPNTIRQNTPLDRIPVFVKKNSIYVSGDVYQGNSKIWNGNLTGNENITIHLFPGEVSEETDFAYVDFLDNDKEKEMLLLHEQGKIVFTSPLISISPKVAVKCFKKPNKILLNGKSVEFNFNKNTTIAEINCPKGVAIKIEIFY